MCFVLMLIPWAAVRRLQSKLVWQSSERRQSCELAEGNIDSLSLCVCVFRCLSDCWRLCLPSRIHPDHHDDGGVGAARCHDGHPRGEAAVLIGRTWHCGMRLPSWLWRLCYFLKIIVVFVAADEQRDSGDGRKRLVRWPGPTGRNIPRWIIKDCICCRK